MLTFPDSLIPVLNDATVLQDHKTCAAALSDSRLVSDPRLAGHPMQPTFNMLFMDGPPHDALKRPVRQGLAGPVALSEPIECDPAAVPDGLQDLGEALLARRVADFACRAVGVKSSQGLASALAGMCGLLEFQSEEQGAASSTAAMKASVAVQRHLARSSGSPTGVLKALSAAVETGQVGRSEVLPTLVVALHGGYENPLNLLTMLLPEVLNNNELRERTRTAQWDTSSSAQLVNRYVSVLNPVRSLLRWAAEPCPQFGLRRGDAVVVSLEHANLQLQNTRQRSASHLAFGAGPHACPGRHATSELVADVLNYVAPLVDRIQIQEIRKVGGRFTHGRAVIGRISSPVE